MYSYFNPCSTAAASLTATRARPQAIKGWVRNVKLNCGWAAIYLFYQAQLFPDYKTQRPALP